MDVNGDNNLTITDVYLIYARIIGRAWRSGVPAYRIFTPTEWSTISTSSTNLKTTYSGTQTITLAGVANKGNSFIEEPTQQLPDLLTSKITTDILTTVLQEQQTGRQQRLTVQTWEGIW